MEDDDEFGDLYTDVFNPFSSTSSSALPPHQSFPEPPLPHPPKQENNNDDAISNHYEIQNPPPNFDPPASFGGFMFSSTGNEAVPDNSAGGQDRRELLPEEDTDMKFDIEEGISHQPGLAISGHHDEMIKLENNGGEKDDWDSDSDDGLRIVLNDTDQGPMGMERGGLIGDEDDENGIFSAADGDPTKQAIEEQPWGESATADTEKKEGVEAGSSNSVNPLIPRVGFINHGYHNPFHSQFKYVRPGATPVPGATPLPGSTVVGPGGPPLGQVRPPVNLVPTAGRGRGEWRPLGMKVFGTPGWGNNMGRGFGGGGLDFTLPSHKTIFEVDIDGFDEKPWKYQGVDLSDFFNFGLNEDGWKAYCKQLEQHRLETTMQNRIHVYESGRTEQGNEPDLPPELAAATGVRDVTADTAKFGMPDTLESDSAKGPFLVRPPPPTSTGRAIPVEGGSGERLPSIDTRLPRIRDSDSLIEIILHDNLEEDNSTKNLADNDKTKEDLADEDDGLLTGYFAYDSRKRKLVNRILYMDTVDDKAPVRDGVISLPSEAPLPCPNSRGQTPVDSSGKHSTPEERTRERSRERSPQLTPGQNARGYKLLDTEEEEAVESTDAKRCPILSSSKDGLLNENLVEKDELISSSNKTIRDGTSQHSVKNKKLSPKVEQPRMSEPDDDMEDSKAVRSSENSRARSSSSRDEKEIMQDGRSSQYGSIKRHLDDNGKSFSRKERDSRYEMDANRMIVKGREDSYHLRDYDPRFSYRFKNEGFDRRKRDNLDGAWQHRDGDMRNKEYGDELGSRHRGKVRENERGDKDERIHSKKQLDNGSYRVRYEKDMGPQYRELDDSFKSRYQIVDDYHHSKRRRDDEYLHKEEMFHGYREDSSRRKREIDDVPLSQKRDEQQRVRANIDDHHSVRPKPLHEENIYKREREEGRAAMRDDRAWAGSTRPKGDYKRNEKKIQPKDAVHVSDQKRKDRVEDESFSHHKGREDVHAHASQISQTEKKFRHEKSSSRNDRAVNASDNPKVHEKKHKEHARKNKESEAGGHSTSTSSKRNQEDQSGLNEMGPKGKTEQGNGSSKIPTHRSSSKKHKENASSGDELHESKRGRSKLERWTSHEERDYSFNSKAAASLKFNSNGALDVNKVADEPIKAVDNQNPLVEEKNVEGDAKPLDDKHLDTVEKLKKRSERFKTPLPSEKDNLVIKNTVNEPLLPSAENEPPPDSEIKPERPARKRRWIGK